MPVVQPPLKDRAQIALTARGLISEVYPFMSAGSGQIPTAGTSTGAIVAGLLGLRAGDLITNLVCFVSVAGTSLTFAKLALYDKTGVFLKATGESSSTFNTGTGFRVIALTS